MQTLANKTTFQATKRALEVVELEEAQAEPLPADASQNAIKEARLQKEMAKKRKLREREDVLEENLEKDNVSMTQTLATVNELARVLLVAETSNKCMSYSLYYKTYTNLCNFLAAASEDKITALEARMKALEQKADETGATTRTILTLLEQFSTNGTLNQQPAPQVPYSNYSLYSDIYS